MLGHGITRTAQVSVYQIENCILISIAFSCTVSRLSIDLSVEVARYTVMVVQTRCDAVVMKKSWDDGFSGTPHLFSVRRENACRRLESAVNVKANIMGNRCFRVANKIQWLCRR